MDVDRTDKDTLIIEGFPFGNNTGSSVKACKFIITKADSSSNGINMVSLSHWSLPCLCPFIQYRLEVEKPTQGCLFSVVRIIRCSPRQVTKAELKKYYAMIDTFKYDFWNDIPDEIDEPTDITYNIQQDKVIHVAKKLKKIIDPAFKKPLFYQLLRYFSGSFLLNLGDSKLEHLQKLYQNKPFAFCFWELAYSYLSGVKEKDKYVFDPTEDHIYIGRDFVFHVKNLSDYESRSMGFSVKYPIWNLTKLRYAYTDQNKELPTDIRVIADAMKIYMEYCSSLARFGNTVISLSKLKNMTLYKPKDTLSFLIDNGILCHPLGDNGRGDLLTKPDIEDTEKKLALHIKKNLERLKFIDCPYYNDFYVAKFTESFATFNPNKETMQVVSANVTTALHMASKTGRDVLCVDDYKVRLRSKNKKRKGSDIRHLFIDRAHKISIIDFYDILYRNEGKNIFIYGDSTDCGLHPMRGYDNVFGQIVGYAAIAPNVVKWNTWHTSDPIGPIYKSLTFGTGMLLSALSIISLEKWKIFIENIKSLDKERKQTMNEYLIFCSSNEDRNEIMPQIFKRKQLISDDYSEDTFYIGQRVHLMETDVWGQIERAMFIDGDNKNQKEVIGKTIINFNLKKYEIQVNGRTFMSNEYKIVHADAGIIQEYAGHPANTIIFVVGKSTTRMHLACAAKYAKKDLIIYIKPGVKFTDVKDSLSTYVYSDFTNKLRSC